MPAYQIQVRGTLDGATPLVIPATLPAPVSGGVIKIDAGAGVNVGTFDLSALAGAAKPVWLRALHVEWAAATRAARCRYAVSGSQSFPLVAPVDSVAGGQLLSRMSVLASAVLAPAGSIVQILTDSVNSTFGGAPVAGPHFVFLDLVPVRNDDESTRVQRLQTLAADRARAEGEVYNSFQAVAATATEELGLWTGPLEDAVGNNTSSGMIQRAQVSVGTAPAAGESMVIAVQRVFAGGVASTMGTITVDNTFSNGQLAEIPLTTNNQNIVAGSVIRISRTYVAGGGPQPMANTLVRIELAPVRQPGTV